MQIVAEETDRLYSVPEACRLLGGISLPFMRKEIAQGSVSVVRLGSRVFVRSSELARIQCEGLPSLNRRPKRGKAAEHSGAKDRKHGD